jgi:YegS/Rv2252/BmrU family lipid kinase
MSEKNELHPRYRRVPVIVNPASGPDRPILRILNNAFRAAGADWDIYLTKREGDAERFAAELAASGAEVIAVCGGDGTVKEAARGLMGSGVPMAIFPAGTGNALAADLCLPYDLARAVALVCNPSAGKLRAVDMGQIDDHYFVLRASMGLETELLRGTDRQLKEQLGKLAYPLTALQQLGSQPVTRYRITIDGRAFETTGVQCTIANSAQMGVANMALAQKVDVSDGFLDVIVLTSANLIALVEIATSNIVGEDMGVEVEHWQGREISVAAEPPQAVALGGDIVAQTPVTARVIPGAIRVIVPG